MRPVRSVLLAAVLATAAGAVPAGAAQPPTWHASQARVSAAAQSAARGGAGVTVAVIDTWVDTAHESFQGRVLGGVDCVGGCRQGVERDNCEHGTHVTGTITSAEYGVAPRARVLPLRILKWDGRRCTGNTADAAAAIRYAVAAGVKVINLSVGGETPLVGSTTAVPGAVREAARAGVLVVFAAGNDGSSVSDAYGEDALVVAATGPTGRIASYSRTGPFITVAAPGGDPADGQNCRNDGSDCVASTYPDNSYAATAGTSMAAPHVAGLGALLFAQGRGRAEVVQRITGTARPLAGAGAGLIDVAAAVGARPAAPAPARTQTAAPRKTTPTRRPAPKAAPPAPPRITVAPKPSVTPAPLPTPSASSAAPVTAAPEPGDTLAVAAPLEREERAVPFAVASILSVAVGWGVVTFSAPRRPRAPRPR